MAEPTTDADAQTATSNDPKKQVRDDPSYTPSAGCAIFILGIALFSGILFFGIWTGTQMNRDIAKFASDDPVEIPSEIGTPEQVKQARAKLDEFKTTIRAGKPATLTVTASDINILIHNNTEFSALRGIVFIDSITPETISGQTSWPVRKLSFSGKRYINGNITMKAEAAPGKIFVRLVSLEVPGKEVPAGFVERVSQNDLLSPYKNEDNEDIFETIQSATMGDGFVTITSEPIEED